MNDEDIEKLLRGLPAPELPVAWGAQILATARCEARAQAEPRREWPPLWLWLRHVFARNPITASALALMWLLIFLFRATTPIDPQEREILAHADLTRPIHLITMADEIQLVELAEDQSPQPRPIP